jgi:hypothetical protein
MASLLLTIVLQLLPVGAPVCGGSVYRRKPCVDVTLGACVVIVRPAHVPGALSLGPKRENQVVGGPLGALVAALA